MEELITRFQEAMRTAAPIEPSRRRLKCPFLAPKIPLPIRNLQAADTRFCRLNGLPGCSASDFQSVMQRRFYEEIEARRCKNRNKQQVTDCPIISICYLSLTIAPTKARPIKVGLLMITDRNRTLTLWGATITTHPLQRELRLKLYGRETEMGADLLLPPLLSSTRHGVPPQWSTIATKDRVTLCSEG
jgi:hypothetical protein